MTKRVVVTGMAGLTAHGDNWESIEQCIKEGRNTIQYMKEWERYQDLRTRLGAPVTYFTKPEHYSRKKVRSMGRVALMATRATEMALQQAGLINEKELTDGSTGIAYGSSSGSPQSLATFANMLIAGSMDGIRSTLYVEMMSHTAAVNIGVFFEIKGRIIPTSSACTSGSQGVGYAYEAIKYGRQKIMVAGGAEELCASQAAVFDTLFATSILNDSPEKTPRPFDKDRDGLVIGEGACTLILEELEHAKARGATIFAEIVGFGTNSDGQHITQPEISTMARAMELALIDAELSTDAVGYVNAHGTATERGDIAESRATEQVFGNQMPISSLKSYYGHTLGACGAIEAWLSIEMMNHNWYAPTINLENLDPECGELDYIQNFDRVMDNEYVMSNNFAFGGINTSLIFKRWFNHVS